MTDNADDPKVFVLGRELSEVHLLLDNLAANPATNLSTLAARSKPDWLPDDWIEQVCSINWPPAEEPRDQAKQAALLIKAKDYLNSLTYPASGATIAFTLLVTQEQETEEDRRRAALDVADGEKLLMAAAPSRRSMARAAYPDLADKARRFRRMMGWMSAFLLAWLLLTCVLSWYVAFGNVQLGELATARTALAAAQARVDTAEAGKAVEEPPEGTEIVSANANTNHFVGYCDLSRLMPAIRAANGTLLPQFETADQRQACAGLTAAHDDVIRVQRSLADWLFRTKDTREAGKITNGRAIADYAGALANIINSAILPVLYGFLGAAAAIVRSLSRKTRASLLTPRDLQLSVQQLALGAVVGACIGLFIAQPDAGDGGASMINPDALSGSALSFIAGFGVDAVFETLEGLIARIFNIAAPARPGDPPPAPIEGS